MNTNTNTTTLQHQIFNGMDGYMPNRFETCTSGGRLHDYFVSEVLEWLGDGYERCEYLFIGLDYGDHDQVLHFDGSEILILINGIVVETIPAGQRTLYDYLQALPSEEGDSIDPKVYANARFTYDAESLTAMTVDVSR